MIYMWFTGINYYKLAVEKDRDSIFIQKRPGNTKSMRCFFAFFPLASYEGSSDTKYILLLYSREWDTEKYTVRYFPYLH
jgi:hypothetical protein